MSWFWYAISASVLWGICYVVNQYVLRYLNSVEVLFFESIFTTFIFLPILVFNGQLKPLIIKFGDLKLLGGLLLTSIIYIAAVICIFKSIAQSNASVAAAIEASYPIFTMIFAYLILGQVQFSLLSLIGTVFVVIGLFIIKLA